MEEIEDLLKELSIDEKLNNKINEEILDKKNNEEILNKKNNEEILNKKNNEELCDIKETIIKNNRENIDLMEIIEKEDKELLINKRILNMSRIDWGKTMAVSNQYIQRNLLHYKLCKYDFQIYSTDDETLPKYIDISNNSSGFDLIMVKPNKEIVRIQSKLRQVNGTFDYSKQIHFETTRRNSVKNKNKNHTGHVCYSLDEFDYVMISLVNDNKNRDKISNCNLWSYAIIPVKELEDKEHNCCISHITPIILQKNLININDDILHIFNN